MAKPLLPAPSRPYLYLPDGWDTVWQAAKAASGTTPAWIAFVGDSYMQGSVSTDFMSKSFRALVRAYVLQSYGLYADFWPACYSADFLTYSGGVFNGTPPWVVNSTTNRSWFLAWATRPLYYTVANAATLATFTTPYACTSMDILHAPMGAGSWQYSVDGGAPVTVNVTATTTMTKISLTGLANTTHTVAFSNVSAANALMLVGITTYTNTSSGIGFAHYAYGGAAAQSFVSTGSQPQPETLWLAGKEKTSSPAGNFGFPSQAHLGIIGLGLNDCSFQAGLQVYEYALADICEGFRAGRGNASILFIAHSSPDLIHSDVTTGLSATQNKMYKHYLAAQLRVAQRYNAATINVHAKWGNRGAALGFQATGQQHPADPGHVDIASLIEEAI